MIIQLETAERRDWQREVYTYKFESTWTKHTPLRVMIVISRPSIEPRLDLKSLNLAPLARDYS